MLSSVTAAFVAAQPVRLSASPSSSSAALSFFSHLSPICRPFPVSAPRRRGPSPISATSEPPSTPPQTPPPPPPPESDFRQSFFGLRLKTNGDVIKFGVVAIALPFAFKYLLQAVGVPDLKAGQFTTGFISVLALLAWISTYVFRVGTKNMTYAQQLRDYEDKVIQKRYEELTEEELAALSEELDDEAS